MNNNIKNISNNQKRKIIQWDISYLIKSLKKEYNIDIIHLETSDVFSKSWFIFNKKTGFPIFKGEDFFGLLVFLKPLNSLKAQKIGAFINYYFNPITEEFKFPVLIKKYNKIDRFKIAYKLYLKTPSFAFLNTEDLNWEKNVFNKMEGIFIYIPCFHQLSIKQKDILSQALIKNMISCCLVIGIKKQEALPPELKKIFKQTV